MDSGRALKIGITCYPSVGGSGILASALGEELARRGHEAHFISYERPFRLPADSPRIFFHPVVINDYGLFKYPDYTLPLSVKMAEVSRDRGLDVLHVHYAVPHATAAILARSMLPAARGPRVVTTLHGTDTTLLGRDAGYGPAIRHALDRSDAVTTVSAFLERETRGASSSRWTGRSTSSTTSSRRGPRGARATRCAASSGWARRRSSFTPRT
jgi:N-acetyl-alpha-D-glucosaminyl L-malate synthase BshA